MAAMGIEDATGVKPEAKPIDKRFSDYFVSLFGDSRMTRQAAETLLYFAQEKREADVDFELVIKDLRPSADFIRRTILTFEAFRNKLQVDVVREKRGGLETRFDCHLIFSYGDFDEVVGVPYESVLFRSKQKNLELAISRNGSFILRPRE